MITRARLTGLAGAATAFVLAATSVPAPAYAAETTATLAEKAAALRALGLEPTAARTGYKDCDLTIEIWNALAGQQFRGEVRSAAVSAYTDPASLAGDASKCTLFLRTEVFAAKQRDVAIQIAAEEQDRIERELKQKAALTIGLPISTDDLGLTVKNFVYLIRTSDKSGPLVKAAALTAGDGTHTDQLAFPGDGIVTAHEADRKREIEEIAHGDEVLRRRLIEEAARKRAMAVLLVAATDGMLAASDRDFITYIWENAAQGTEVRGAAERAVLSREPADWNGYIHTGIHEAREADRQLALRKKYEADVAKAEEVLAQADKEGYHVLAIAARKALAGSATELGDFVSSGQYDLDLITGFENGEVPLNWSHSPAWTGSIRNVNACSLADTATYKDAVAKAVANVTAKTKAVKDAEAALAAATTAAAKAAAQAKLITAKLNLQIAQDHKAEMDKLAATCAAKAPENSVVAERAHSGGKAIRVYGVDQNTTQSYAYFQALNLSRITVKPTTKLTYWVYPEANTTVGHVVAANSTCLAVDLTFSNGANLRDSGAVDQKGNRAHPAHQCGQLTPESWNKVEVSLAGFNGRAITGLQIAYDQPGNTGAFRGYIDDISIAD